MNEKELEEKRRSERNSLLEEIGEIRSEVDKSKQIGRRAQEDVLKGINEIFELLCREDDCPERLFHEASFKIAMVHKRIEQASTPRMLLGIKLGVILFAITVLVALGIGYGKYWPKVEGMSPKDILYGCVLWGALGAVINGIRELHTRLARQELDPNRWAWYISHPLLGGGFGAIIFLLVYSGLWVTVLHDNNDNINTINPSLPLVLSALAGFEQQTIIIYLRKVIQQKVPEDRRDPDERG
jgi:hypothetical protein